MLSCQQQTNNEGLGTVMILGVLQLTYLVSGCLNEQIPNYLVTIYLLEFSSIVSLTCSLSL